MRKFIFILGLCYPLASFAVLGESTNSITQDQRKLNPSLKLSTKLKPTSTLNSIYQKYTFTTQDKILVNEYSYQNKVFAVTWSGTYNPDLNQLLGKYFTQIKTAKPVVQNLRMRYIHESDLIIHTFGITGNFSGAAYIPSLMPQNITINDLR